MHFMVWDHHSTSILRAHVYGLILVSWLCRASLAWGDTTPTAQDLWGWYGEASRLHDQGKVNEAWKLYKKIWQHKQTYDVAASMGDICMRRAQFALAARYYRFAIDSVVPTQSPDFVNAVKEEYAQARREVTEVEVTVSPKDAQGLRIIDLATDVELEKPIFLEVGNHRLRAEAPGYVAVEKVFVAQPGGSVQWNLELVPVENPVITPDQPRTTKTRHPVLVFGIGGAVTAGLGVGSYLMGQQARDIYEDGERAGAQLPSNACHDVVTERCRAFDRAYTRAARSERVAIGLAAGAGLTAVTTLLVYWLWEDETEVSVSLNQTPHGGWNVGVSHAF